MFYLKKRRLRRVMATVFKHITGEPNIIHVHSAHVTRKIQIRHKGILSIKVSKHWHCQVNSPMSVVFRDRCGIRCSEMTQPEVILCEGTRMELMNSPGASFAPRFNVAGKKPQQLIEAHWETPCVFQLSRQRCHPCHALPKHNSSGGLIRMLSVTAWKTLVAPSGMGFTSPPPPALPRRAGPRWGAREQPGTRPRGDRWGVRGALSPVWGIQDLGVRDPWPRCEGAMIPVRGKHNPSLTDPGPRSDRSMIQM